MLSTVLLDIDGFCDIVGWGKNRPKPKSFDSYFNLTMAVKEEKSLRS